MKDLRTPKRGDWAPRLYATVRMAGERGYDIVQVWRKEKRRKGNHPVMTLVELKEMTLLLVVKWLPWLAWPCFNGQWASVEKTHSLGVSQRAGRHPHLLDRSCAMFSLKLWQYVHQKLWLSKVHGSLSLETLWRHLFINKSIVQLDIGKTKRQMNSAKHYVNISYHTVQLIQMYMYKSVMWHPPLHVARGESPKVQENHGADFCHKS